MRTSMLKNLGVHFAREREEIWQYFNYESCWKRQCPFTSFRQNQNTGVNSSDAGVQNIDQVHCRKMAGIFVSLVLKN